MDCGSIYALAFCTGIKIILCGINLKKMKKNRKEKRLLGLLFLFFAVCFCSGCRGCSKVKLDKQKNAMLWEISGNGLSHKSYLFGTMHGGGHNFTQEEIFTAFPQLCEVLENVSCMYLEQSKNFNDSAVVADCMASASVFTKADEASEYNTLPQGESYHGLYDNEEQFRLVDNFFSEKLHRFSYVQFKPAYWVERLRLIRLKGKVRTVSVDDCLYHGALQKNIKVFGLETYEELARTLVETIRDTAEYHKSLKEQAVDLYNVIAQIEKVSVSAPFHEMYLSGDLEKLYAHNQSLIPKGVDDSKMVAERNIKWLKKIEDHLKDRACLIAVGVMHLPGDKGLISLLRDKGYVVQPVR